MTDKKNGMQIKSESFLGVAYDAWFILFRTTKKL